MTEQINLGIYDISQTSLLVYIRALKLNQKQETELFREIIKFYREHIESHKPKECIDFVESLIPKD